MTGIQLNECELRDILFEDTRLDLANLRMARLERVTFRDCSLTEADFADADLASVRFERSTCAGPRSPSPLPSTDLAAPRWRSSTAPAASRARRSTRCS